MMNTGNDGNNKDALNAEDIFKSEAEIKADAESRAEAEAKEAAESDATESQPVAAEAGGSDASGSVGDDSASDELSDELSSEDSGAAVATAAADEVAGGETPAEASSSEPVGEGEAAGGESGVAVAETTAGTDVQSEIVDGQEVVSPAAASELDKNPDLAWYVVNAYSGYEMKVKQALEERIRMHDMGHLFGDVQVPQETVTELVKGQKKTSSRKYFPGYVLVEMVMNEDTWHLVKETPKVSGFVGDRSDPVPMEPEEVARILTQVEEGTSATSSRIKFEEGETVKVVDGPFSDFNGTIEEIKPEKGKLKVLISIFGRATPVELDFVQVEKV